MKKFKRFLALLTVAVLVMSMGMGAMATQTTNVEGAEYDTAYFTPSAESVDLIGHTFNAVQVIAAEKYEDGEYKGISWGAQIADKGAALLVALQEDDILEGDFEDYVIDPADVTEEHPLFTAAAFADVIEPYTTAEKKEALIKVIKGLGLTGQEISVAKSMSPVPLTAGIGLYLIDDISADSSSLSDDVSNASILMAVPGSNKIRIKVDKPTQDKQVKENTKAEWNEVSDYNIGDYVPYKITSKIPNAEKFQDYTMTFKDEMSSGLTFADTVSGVTDVHKLTIKVGETTLASTDYELTPSTNGFTLKLVVKKDGTQTYTAGSEIEIDFYGLLNTGAEIGTDGNTNKSKLTYSNDPDSDSTTDTTWDKVITFTYELDVEKIDGVTKEKLPGAQFSLMATTGEHNGKYAIVDENGILSGWADADAEPQADDTDNGALLIADEEGNFKVVGLDDGTYTLTEVKAPAGYNPIQPISVTIGATTSNGDDYTEDLHDTASDALTELQITVKPAGEGATTDDGDTAKGTVEMTVANNSGASLPETGGVGTSMFYIAGAALVIGAGVVLVSRRRMNAQ